MKLLSFLVITALPISAHAVADPLSDLDGILAQQRSENYACNKFRKKWHNVVKGGLTSDSPSHVSKQQALDALKLLEKFRFHGTAQAKAWAYVVENETALRQLPDQKEVMAHVIPVMEQPCEVFSRGVHRQLLLKDVAALSLSKKEAKGVAAEAKDFLRHQGAGTLSGLGMKLRFLATYLGTIYDGDDKDALKTRADALLKDFDDSLEKIKPEKKLVSDAGHAGTIEYWEPELRAWNRINPKLETIVGELQD